MGNNFKWPGAASHPLYRAAVGVMFGLVRFNLLEIVSPISYVVAAWAAKMPPGVDALERPSPSRL